MALVRCPKHGRVYDDAQDAKCPLCQQEVSMPRAPGRARQEPAPAQASGRMMLLAVLLVIALIAGGAYYYFSTHTAADRAQVVRDSLRAAAAAPVVDTTHFARADDLTPIRRARALRATLLDILSDNRATVLGLTAGPIDTAATDRATRRSVQRYQAFYQRYTGRLDAATRNGSDFRYAPGVQYSLQMENVTNQLRAALSVMRDMIRPLEVKPRTERQEDLRAAAGYLNAAGTVLTNLPK